MKSITLELIRIGYLSISLKVSIGKQTPEEYIPLIKEYKENGRMTMAPSLILQYNDYGKTPWDREQGAFLFPNDFIIFKELINAECKIITNDFNKIFKRENGTIFICDDSIGNISMTTKMTNVIVIKPAILQYTETKMDINYKPIEGVRIILNGKYVMDLQITELKILNKLLEKIDMYGYALNMVNICSDNSSDNIQVTVPNNTPTPNRQRYSNNRPSVFDSTPQENTMTSNINTNIDGKSFDDFFKNNQEG